MSYWAGRLLSLMAQTTMASSTIMAMAVGRLTVSVETTIGAMIREIRLMTLISGLSAGPAVSLSGSPTVSPTMLALCASEPLPP